MAKATLNSALKSLQGELDNWVYRKTGSGQVVGKRPVPTAAEPSAAQLAAQEQFRAAAAYAKAAAADAVLGPRYAAAAKEAGKQPYAFAFADFFRPPVVEGIDLAEYHGAIGGVIKVRAVDDFEVAGVKVAIRDAANSVLEQGAAVLVNGQWHYTATVLVPAGTEIAIEAVATDRPGHTGTRVVTLTVA